MSTAAEREESLWDYIDGRLTADEHTRIGQLIAEDAAWRAQYQDLLEVQQWLQQSELEEPSMRFSKNVMDEIARTQISPAANSYINKNIIRGLTIFFLTMIAGFLIYGFGQLDFSASGSEKLPVDITNIDYSVFFNNDYLNAFMLLNIVLGLWLFDQFLSSRRKRWQGSADF